MKIRLAYLTLLLGIVLAMGQSAQAESLRFHVPFEFKAAGRILPAGDYTLETTGRLLLIRGAAPGTSAMIMTLVEDSRTEIGNPSASFEMGEGMPILCLATLSGGDVLRISPVERSAPRASAPGTVLLSRH